ncbi:MAG: hypothetical protein ABEJ72_09660 [Candidatus Aenigmatarchaeota archaeon]
MSLEKEGHGSLEEIGRDIQDLDLDSLYEIEIDDRGITLYQYNKPFGAQIPPSDYEKVRDKASEYDRKVHIQVDNERRATALKVL